MLPGEVKAEQLIGSGKGDFGVSYQNQLIKARAEGLPIVSVAAIIQHTSFQLKYGYFQPLQILLVRREKSYLPFIHILYQH